MQKENFKTELEYKNKYPSGLYICSNCRAMTSSATYCQNCGWSVNGLFGTMNKGYIHSIADGQPIETFQPIELFELAKKGNGDERCD